MARYKPSDQQLADFLREVEVLMQEVRNDYELYFLQQIRRAPQDRATVLQRKIREMDRLPTHNTQLKFLRNTLRAKYSSLNQYWTRVMKQIEEGTYRRHIEMADRREAMRRRQQLELERARKARRRPQQRQPASADPEDEDTADTEDTEDQPRRAAGAGRPAGRRADRPRRLPASAAAFDAGSPELLQAYSRARSRTGEPGLSPAETRMLALKLKKHAMAMRARGAGDVRYRVTIEGGRARLKAIKGKE